MKKLTLAALLLSLGASALAQTSGSTSSATPGQRQEMVVTRAGTQASTKGPASFFSGSVRVDPLFGAHTPSTASGAAVTFEPAARSAWHTHPLGQVIIVTAGAGRVQQWGGPLQEIRPGDVVWTPPGMKHWHGAAPTTALTHITIQEAVNGKNVDWMEKVSDEQYAK